MKVRTFRLPFTAVAALPGFEFDTGDYFVVRPLSARPGVEAEEWAARIEAMGKEVEALVAKDARAADERFGNFVAELMAACITDWRLVGEMGEAIGLPRSAADLRALPAGLNAPAWFEFLARYRGEEPNPTPSG